MKYYVEESLSNFKFWSGGEDRACMLSSDELDACESLIDELWPDELPSDSEINDLFWFDFSTVARHLGYENEQDFTRKRDPNYIDDDELVEYCDEWFHNLIDELKARGDEKSYNILGDIAYECFDYYSEVEENPEYGEDNYDFLAEIHDNQTIFDAIFADNTGDAIATGVIPTLEDFRDEIMTKISKDKSNEK